MLAEIFDGVSYAFEEPKLRTGFKETGKSSVVVRLGGVSAALL